MIDKIKRSSSDSSQVAFQNAQRLVLGEARDIRVRMQDLLLTLDQIDAADALTDQDLKTATLEQAHQIAQQRFTRSSPQITKRLEAISAQLDADPKLNDRVSDQFEQIVNKWERMCDSWPGRENSTAAEAPANSKTVRPLVNDILYLIGQITIPVRLNQHLRQIHVGESFNFNARFADELPDPDARKRLLEYLAAHPAAVLGLVDVDNGTVVRTSDSIRGQLKSVAMIFVAALAPISLVYLDRQFSGFDSFFLEENKVGDFVKLYVAVLAGAVAHFVIALIKSQRAGQSLVLAQQLAWINSKQGTILISILAIWFVTYGAWRALGEFDRDTGFFVGYSLDSFVDVMLKRFNTTVNTQNTAIQQKLAPSGS